MTFVPTIKESTVEQLIAEIESRVKGSLIGILYSKDGQAKNECAHFWHHGDGTYLVFLAESLRHVVREKFITNSFKPVERETDDDDSQEPTT